MWDRSLAGQWKCRSFKHCQHPHVVIISKHAHPTMCSWRSSLTKLVLSTCCLCAVWLGGRRVQGKRSYSLCCRRPGVTGPCTRLVLAGSIERVGMSLLSADCSCRTVVGPIHRHVEAGRARINRWIRLSIDKLCSQRVHRSTVVSRMRMHRLAWLSIQRFQTTLIGQAHRPREVSRA